MKKIIQKKMAQSQWRWDNIFKAATGLLAIVAAIITVIVVSCSRTEAKAVETKVTLYDVPIDIELLDHISGLSADYEIPVELVLAVIEKESSFNEEAVSAVGAKGLMQILPEYHQDRMKRLGCKNLFNPKQNVTVGVDFLAELIEKNGGNLNKALTAYNFGQNGANKLFFSKGKESSSYSRSVLETAEKIKGEITEMYIRTDNPVRDEINYTEEKENLLAKCPVCIYCNEHIQDEYLYEINDELICEECIKDNFRKPVEDYVEC